MKTIGQTSDNNVMHAKPDLRVFLKWMIARSGSVITDVMSLKLDTELHFSTYPQVIHEIKIYPV